MLGAKSWLASFCPQLTVVYYKVLQDYNLAPVFEGFCAACCSVGLAGLATVGMKMSKPSVNRYLLTSNWFTISS